MYQLEIFTLTRLHDGSYDSIILWFPTLEELYPIVKLFVDQGYEVRIDNPSKMSENPCR